MWRGFLVEDMHVRFNQKKSPIVYRWYNFSPHFVCVSVPPTHSLSCAIWTFISPFFLFFFSFFFVINFFIINIFFWYVFFFVFFSSHYFIRCTASLLVVDICGNTPLEVARGERHVTTVRLIEVDTPTIYLSIFLVPSPYPTLQSLDHIRFFVLFFATAWWTRLHFSITIRPPTIVSPFISSRVIYCWFSMQSRICLFSANMREQVDSASKWMPAFRGLYNSV